MRPKTRIYLFFAAGIIALLTFVCAFAVCFADPPERPGGQNEKLAGEKANGNSKCYVCHPSLKTEEITTAHLEMDVTCDDCHGVSVEHMHDEMLMTRPDLLFGRSEVDKMCSNPSCHQSAAERGIYGRQDHKDRVKVEAFYKEWQGRTRPNGRAVMPNSVCTDCHGTHNLDKAVGKQSEQDVTNGQIEWIACFNGRDLTGWQQTGAANWIVKSGQIVGVPGTNGEGGTLWSQEIYDDYLLAVTFRATWPIRAGIWLRSADLQSGPRVEIFDWPTTGKSTAFTGSVWMPDVGLVLVNLREQLVDRESWNTLSVKVTADRVQVWLSGEEIGAVKIIGTAKGRIGLHIEKYAESKTAELCIREVLIHHLTEPGQPVPKPAATEPNKPTIIGPK